MSFRLNELQYISAVFSKIPESEVELLVQGLPHQYVQRYAMEERKE
jgi:hypothetical protein